MTFGEKLTQLRREQNYTQEQLADILQVSRQSVSKWESDIAYPETEKLIKIGELFDCSMDFLLKDDVKDKTQSEKKSAEGDIKISLSLGGLFNNFHFERKSKRRIFGLPLYHINIGIGRCAKGFFSFGLSSIGIFSFGLFSLGIVSFGVISIGLLALGAFAIGGIALGAISLGILALGAISFGIASIGAIAIGQFARGDIAIGNYLAIGESPWASSDRCR